MTSLDPVSKFLILTGLALIVGGLLWHFGFFNYVKLGRLPGDIIIERQNTKIYIPIVTCLLLSMLLSLISYFFRK